MRRVSLTAPALFVAAILAAPTAARADDAAASTTASPIGVAVPATTPAVAATGAIAAPAPTGDLATQSAAPPAAPTFSLVGRSKVAKDGTITLNVVAPTAGKYLGFAVAPAGANSTTALTAGAARVQSPLDNDAPMPLRYADAGAWASAGQSVPLVFRPGKVGKVVFAARSKARPLRITIMVLFGPNGGTLARNIYVVKIPTPGITKVAS